MTELSMRIGIDAAAAIIAGMSAAQLRRTDVPRTKVGRREYIAPAEPKLFLETQRATRA